MSQLVFRTLREPPADAEFASHSLLVRAGMVRQVAAGIFAYLPLGQRVKRKVEAVVRARMEAIGGQEVAMPVVQPAELWQRSGRWYEIGADMARLTDAAGRDLCLGMTHEEVVTDVTAQIVESYRQLPFMLFQIQTKFRDERRPRGGLIRIREFTMKDGYSFHADATDLDAYYPRVYQAYFDIFRMAGLDVMTVASDTGMMGGTMAHEFMAPAPVGEDTLVVCAGCGYRANRQVATFGKPLPSPEDALPLDPVDTPGATTIADVAAFLRVPTARTAKAVFFVADVDDPAVGPGATAERLVFAVVRGDMEVNETKVTNAVRARALRPATIEEIRAIGAEPGFGSPVGIDRDRAIVIVDDLVAASPNLVGGANRPDTHYRNVNYGRDFTADVVADIVAAGDGHPCPRCRAPLAALRGIEVGNTFKLGTKYSEAMGAFFADAAGEMHPCFMGCYGIGCDRLLATVVEQRHDDAGIVWPVSIAPYDVSLVSLGAERDAEVAAAADGLYHALGAAGVEVLFDDRAERAGVKFNDADLIGLPLRVTVGARGLAGGTVELKLRAGGEVRSVPIADASGAVTTVLDELRREIAATLTAEEVGR